MQIYIIVLCSIVPAHTKIQSWDNQPCILYNFQRSEIFSLDIL